MAVANIVKSIQDIMRQDVGVDGDAQRISQLCWLFFLKIIDDQDQELELLKDGYRSPVPAPLQWRIWAADPEGVTGDDLLAFVNDNLFPTLKQLPATAGARADVVRGVFEDAYNYMKSGQLIRQVVNRINDIDLNNHGARLQSRHQESAYDRAATWRSCDAIGPTKTAERDVALIRNRLKDMLGETLLQ